MKYLIVPVTPFAQNCSILWCEKTLRAAIIDPGGDIERLLAEVANLGLHLEKILLTHGHIDHVGGALALARQTGVPIVGPHVADNFWLSQLPMQSQRFGFPPSDAFEPCAWLSHGDRVQVGELALSVLHCPGHTPGHLVFFCAEARLAFVGDVLFRRSIGRTDFPQSDHQALIDSITTHLWPLGDEVQFVPGHGPMSTLGEERRFNPFVADRLFG